jgi:hypothetical protein
MKRNIFIIILLIFFGTIFFIGWTQFKVKPNSFGILVSKTNGIDPTPIKPGEYSWHWEFLLPTNAQIKQFTINPVNTTKTISGNCASGNIYSNLVNTTDNFDYSFTYSISLTYEPEDVIELLKENIISNQEDLNAYLNNAADLVAKMATDYYLKEAEKNKSFRVEYVRRDELTKEMQIYREVPFVNIAILSLTNSKIPDFELYRRLQQSYLNKQTVPTTEITNDTNNTQNTPTSQDNEQ